MIVVNLDRLLAQRKMRSTELADKLGCTVQTVSRIKTGKIKSLRMDTLDALCEQFTCQPGDVLEYISEEDAVERFGADFVAAHRQARH